MAQVYYHTIFLRFYNNNYQCRLIFKLFPSNVSYHW